MMTMSAPAGAIPPIVMLCQLPYWTDAQQRPHHLGKLFSQLTTVAWVQEPVLPKERNAVVNPYVATTVPPYTKAPGDLRLYAPFVHHQRNDLPTVTRKNQRIARSYIKDQMAISGITKPILWVNSPMMYSYYRGIVEPQLIIIDKMDELSTFKGASADAMRRAEDQVLKDAHLVFAGGKSLFETVKDRHSRVFQFDSAVDIDLLAKARCKNTEIHPDIRHLAGPIIGYIGVIDERLDSNAIRAISQANPNWTVFMGGPITKIDPATLPRANNIVYQYDIDKARGHKKLGGISHADLPSYLKGFTVGLIPFNGISPATKYLSPTKGPEYAVADVPVVSGAVPDVITNWGNYFSIAHSPEEYPRLIKEILDGRHVQRTLQAREKACENTWQSTATSMLQHILELL